MKRFIIKPNWGMLDSDIKKPKPDSGQKWTVEFTGSDRPILNRHDGTEPVTYPREFTQAVKETVAAHNNTLRGEDTQMLEAATEKAWQDGYDANPRAEFERKWSAAQTGAVHDFTSITDDVLENVITALGQCQKGTARQFIDNALRAVAAPPSGVRQKWTVVYDNARRGWLIKSGESDICIFYDTLGPNGNTFAEKQAYSVVNAHNVTLRGEDTKRLLELLQRARSYVAKPIPHCSTPSTSALLLEHIDAAMKEQG